MATVTEFRLLVKIMKMKASKATKKKTDAKEPSHTNIKICYRCGEMVLGEYEYIKTKRGTEIYLHKECVGGKDR